MSFRSAMVLFVAVLAACADDVTCDEDQMVSAGFCVPRGADAGPMDAGETDGSADDVTEDAPAEDAGDPDAGFVCEPDPPEPVPFDTPCTDDETHSECGCPAPFCAIQPGSETGVCTAVGCNETPEVCPAGYRCLDLTGVGLLAFCIPE